jgi:hypothetical protein
VEELLAAEAALCVSRTGGERCAGELTATADAVTAGDDAELVALLGSLEIPLPKNTCKLYMKQKKRRMT